MLTLTLVNLSKDSSAQSKYLEITVNENQTETNQANRQIKSTFSASVFPVYPTHFHFFFLGGVGLVLISPKFSFLGVHCNAERQRWRN